MSAPTAHRGSLQRLHRRRHWPAAMLALLCYGLAGAVVPPGHMAAPLASGTVFHLCPGDLRSAQVLDALIPAAPAGEHGHHHHGHAPPADDAAGPAPALAKSHADPGCSFAGAGSAAPAAADGLALLSPDGDAVPAVLLPSSLRPAPAWLRPPVRSPPA